MCHRCVTWMSHQCDTSISQMCHMDVTCHKNVTPAFHMNVSQVCHMDVTCHMGVSHGCHINVNVLTQVCFKDDTTASTRMPPLSQKVTLVPHEHHKHTSTAYSL